MFPSPRVIAIDNESNHLAGLADGLNRHGVACLQIHFTGDPTGIKPCPDVRVIFADLHLGAAAPFDHSANFSMMGGLLEDTIKPSGPYFIVLWTQFPDQAPALRNFLERLQGVTQPFDVLPLAKANHLDSQGKVKDQVRLMEEIVAFRDALPQVGALFDWENRVLGATGDTVSSLLKLASTQEADERAGELGRILARLGIEAVGEAHVDRDRFRAVNEGLFPILADRIANLRQDESEEKLWPAAFDIGSGSLPRLSLEEAAKLNRLAHISDPGSSSGSERGSVILLPASLRANFEGTFGIDEESAAKGQFRCKEFAPDDERFRWVLVQAQAACDHAQTQPGPMPFYLGLDLPETHESKNRKAPPSLWTSPAFEFDGEVRLLPVSARFPVSLSSSEAQKSTLIYRLREEILNDLVYHLHSYGARPGKISFQGK